MRRIHSLLFLPILALPVLTLPVLALPAGPPGSVVASDATSGVAVGHHARQTWEQHFTGANLAHDGHLTLAEAQGGYPLAAKHFEEIDASHKGYVTEDDFRTWRATRKAAHRIKPGADKLRPRSAVHRVYPDNPMASTAAPRTIAVSADSSATLK